MRSPMLLLMALGTGMAMGQTITNVQCYDGQGKPDKGCKAAIASGAIQPAKQEKPPAEQTSGIDVGRGSSVSIDHLEMGGTFDCDIKIGGRCLKFTGDLRGKYRLFIDGKEWVQVIKPANQRSQLNEIHAGVDDGGE